MNAAVLSRLSRWSVVGGLIALLPFLKASYLLLLLPVLMLQLTVTPSRPAPYELFTVVMTLTALPLAAASASPAAGLRSELLLLLLLLPGLPWLDAVLRRCSAWVMDGPVSSLPLPGGRGATLLLLVLSAGLLIQAAVGAVTGQTLLAATALALFAIIAALAAWAYLRFPGGGFLSSRPPSVRTLAGETIAAAVTLSSLARQDVYVSLRTASGWAAVHPATVALAPGGEHPVHLRVTPPLAGPGTITAVATALDPRGLITARQEIELAEVRVIPRAVYAAWLARQYLEHSRSGAVPAGTTAELERPRATHRGLDYYGARLYEPGDTFRDVFWKPTLKLGQLVVKDRREGHGEPVIVAVNLTAPDAEEEDRLAYTLLMTALTLVREGVPVAFAAYTLEAVAEVTPTLPPQTAVRTALGLVERMRIAPRPRWVLRPPQMIRLRRTVTRLVAAASDPAMRLARFLALEHEALLQRTRTHPGAVALARACALVPPPAAVLPIAPAVERALLETTLQRLEGKGFHLLPAAGDGQTGLASRATPVPQYSRDGHRGYPT